MAASSRVENHSEMLQMKRTKVFAIDVAFRLSFLPFVFRFMFNFLLWLISFMISFRLIEVAVFEFSPIIYLLFNGFLLHQYFLHSFFLFLTLLFFLFLPYLINALYCVFLYLLLFSFCSLSFKVHIYFFLFSFLLVTLLLFTFLVSFFFYPAHNFFRRKVFQVHKYKVTLIRNCEYIRLVILCCLEEYEKATETSQILKKMVTTLTELYMFL